MKRVGVLSVNRSARVLGVPFGLFNEPGERNIQLRAPSWRDEPRRLAVYACVAAMWALSAWCVC